MKAVSWQERAATLAEARQLAHAGERGAALQLLLALWRSAPGVVPAELGDAIARLGEELRLRTEKLGGNAAVRQRAWLKRGKAVRSKKGASDGEVELLLDDLSQGSLVSAKARLAMVVGWPADPRIDRTVLRLLREVPYPSASSRPFWRSLLERATKLRDARALAELPTALDALLRGVTLELATIGKATASREMLTAQADELLAAIQADPLDNAARRVYADVLNELGDPRGSFIELSFRQSEGTLDKTQERTLKRLLKTHGRDWLGALDKVVAHSDIAFERGFLAACRMRKLSQQAAEKLAGHPLFSTVERFEGPAPIYLHPVMRALREVVADADGAEALLGDEDPRPHIDTLIYVGPRATSGTALRYQRVSDWPPVELEGSSTPPCWRASSG